MRCRWSRSCGLLPDVEAALVRLARQPHCLLLDSALRDPRWAAIRS